MALRGRNHAKGPQKQRGERTPKTVTGHGITHVKPCPVHCTNLTIAGRPKPPLSYLRKSHPHAWNNHPESTTPMEPKHDQSVEIYEKSPDMNLVISYDENLVINIQSQIGSGIRCQISAQQVHFFISAKITVIFKVVPDIT